MARDHLEEQRREGRLALGRRGLGLDIAFIVVIIERLIAHVPAADGIDVTPQLGEHGVLRWPTGTRGGNEQERSDDRADVLVATPAERIRAGQRFQGLFNVAGQKLEQGDQ